MSTMLAASTRHIPAGHSARESRRRLRKSKAEQSWRREARVEAEATLRDLRRATERWTR